MVRKRVVEYPFSRPRKNFRTCKELPSPALLESEKLEREQQDEIEEQRLLHEGFTVVNEVCEQVPLKQPPKKQRIEGERALTHPPPFILMMNDELFNNMMFTHTPAPPFIKKQPQLSAGVR